MAEGLHRDAIEYFRQYLIVGGMPEAVNTYLETGKFLDVASIQNEIVNNYIADMAKYASNTDSVKIRACYNSIPAQLAKENRKFQYKVVQKGGTTAIFGVSIEWLNLAGVVLKCQRIEHGYEPIPAYADLSSFKLYMSDVGILTMKASLPHHIILSGEGNTFLGALAENYVAMQLKAKGYDLYYWSSEHSAELDFVIIKDQRVYGIEVKKGERVRSKSLSQNLIIAVLQITYHHGFKSHPVVDIRKDIPLIIRIVNKQIVAVFFLRIRKIPKLQSGAVAIA